MKRKKAIIKIFLIVLAILLTGVTTVYAVLAIDSEGKVWIWGTSRKYVYPTCKSDDTNLKDLYDAGIKIVNAAIYGDSIILVDDLGRVWNSGGSFKTGSEGEFGCVSTADFGTDSNEVPLNQLKAAYDRGVRVVDVGWIDGGSYAVLIDSEGKLWYTGSANCSPTNEAVTDYFKCISNVEGTKFKELADAGVKLIKIATSSYNTYIVDSNGKLWAFGSKVNESLGVPNGEVTCVSAGSRTIVYVVDEYGDIYLCKDNLFSSIKNDLYKVKVTKLDGEYVIDENNNKWTLRSKATIVGDYTEEAKEEAREKTKEELEAKISTTIEDFREMSTCSVGLDSNGQVWFSGYISGIEDYAGTQKGEIIEEFTLLNFGENVKTTKIPYKRNYLILLCDNGKLYKFSSNTNGNILDGIYITDALYTDYYGFFKDIDGNIYASCDYYGYNTYGQIGVGTTGAQWEPAKVLFDENVDINLEDITYDDEHIYYKDTTNHLWITGRNDYYQCGDGTTSNRTTPYKVVTSTGDEIKVKQVVNNSLSTYLLDENGYVYASGGDPSATASSSRLINRCQFEDSGRSGDRFGNRNKFERIMAPMSWGDGSGGLIYTSTGIFKEIRLLNDYVIGIESNDNIVEWGNDKLRTSSPVYAAVELATGHSLNQGNLIKIIENPACKYLDSYVLQTADNKIYSINPTTYIETTNKEIAETYGDSYLGHVLIRYTDGTLGLYKTGDNRDLQEAFTVLTEGHPEITQKSLSYIMDLMRRYDDYKEIFTTLTMLRPKIATLRRYFAALSITCWIL